MTDAAKIVWRSGASSYIFAKEFTMGYHEICPYHPGLKTSLCEGIYLENGKEKICSWKIHDQKKCSLAQEGTK